MKLPLFILLLTTAMALAPAYAAGPQITVARPCRPASTAKSSSNWLVAASSGQKN